MEGLGQHTTFPLNLTKQTWAVSSEERAGRVGRDGDRALSGDSASSPSCWTGAGVVLLFLVPTLVGAGWEGIWGWEQWEGVSSPPEQEQLRKGLLESDREGSECCTETLMTVFCLPWLFTILLPFCPLHPLLSPHV